mmetsp:Transcript_24169/g.73072  ORF Transcript_24169/g.73072 Transcript_24169/m.73072 type:complete len:205 (+) Transcript_24169:1-615(+)
MELQLWDCTEAADRFIVPVKGRGTIRIHGSEHYCLDAPGGTQLQFWECGKAPRRNIIFRPRDDTVGAFSLDKDPGICLDVPNEITEEGNFLQMWSCADGHGDKLFSVRAPVHCHWSRWGEWGNCSEACGGGHRIRSREALYGLDVQSADTGRGFFYPLRRVTHTHFGGRECEGEPSELKVCNTQHCPIKSESTWFWNADAKSPT